MKKIGLVTLYENNYGSILQCFSTKKFIEMMGNKCDVLCEKIGKQTLMSKIMFWSKYLMHPSFFSRYLKMRENCKVGSRHLSIATKQKMKFFVENNIKPVVLSKDENSISQYDLFITGSDQVWNSSLMVNPFNFLSFSPRHKRIALATSFGGSDIPSYNEKALIRYLNGFDFISVREESSVKMIKKYSPAKVIRIPDPTLIFSHEDWKIFAKDVPPISDKYILVHFLNEPNRAAIDTMVWLSDKFKMKILAIGYNYECFQNLSSLTIIDGSPNQYISLIDNSSFVLTDSFHTTLFSINMRKRFFTFCRQYLADSQSNRIVDLLNRFHLCNRLIKSVSEIQDCVQDELPASINEILDRERFLIRDYVLKSISDQIPQCFLQGENDAT